MKILLIISLALASVIILASTDQYLFCPVYSFANPSSFSGDSLYNPYASSMPNAWVKCNFHAHTRCWDGLTYGFGTDSNVNTVYQRLNYGVHAVSNYQFIDTAFNQQANYISAYEHGCNVLKNHQLVLGADKVCWKDYYLPQTLSNKQDILNCLAASDTSCLYIINHPLVRNGYCAADFASLTNYSCMEVLNPACNSSVLWDAALSAGKPVFIVGDDDVHNASDTNTVGRICTWVNTQKINKTNIIKALQTGSDYAMTIGKTLMEQERHGETDSMPMLNRFTVKNSLINAGFTLPANEITVTGKNGEVLAHKTNSDSISYQIDAPQPYARITATYNNGTKLYLNPVFRHQKSPLKKIVASIDTTKTLLSRTLGVIILLSWFTLVFRLIAPIKYQSILLPFIYRYKYEFTSGNTAAKGFQIWSGRLIRYVHRFFSHLVVQRKV